MLRAAYSGKIELVPDEAGGLVAHWNLQTAARCCNVQVVAGARFDRYLHGCPGAQVPDCTRSNPEVLEPRPSRHRPASQAVPELARAITATISR
jgi:hypothetical protein